MHKYVVSKHMLPPAIDIETKNDATSLLVIHKNTQQQQLKSHKWSLGRVAQP